jgi:hypothetical protein
MEKNREYFKNLLADNAQDTLYDELFALLSWHKTRYTDRIVAEKYDELVLLSGKLNSLQQGSQLGTLSVQDFHTEMSRINFALLDLLNDLPDSFFQQSRQTDVPVVTGVKTQYGIPAGLKNGLFWMGAVIMGMITGGSAVQGNWIPFAFTLLASLICLPPTFDYVTNRLGISVSGSIRVLLIVVLTVVGLSFAPTTQRGPSGQVQPVTR